MKHFIGKPAAFLVNFFVTVMLFALVNIIDVITGRGEPKYYPFMTYLIFTFVVSSFLYMGWKVAYFTNAAMLYGLSIYSVFYHPKTDSSVSWLLGSLPLPFDQLIFVPFIFLASLVVQFIMFRFSRRKDL